MYNPILINMKFFPILISNSPNWTQEIPKLHGNRLYIEVVEQAHLEPLKPKLGCPTTALFQTSATYDIT